MPFVNIKILREAADAPQKSALIEGITKVVSEVLGKDPNATYVVIDEVETDNWGIGGKSITEKARGPGADFRMIWALAGILVFAAIVLILAWPRISVGREVRQIFADYDRYIEELPGDEAEIWSRTARAYFLRLGWKEGRIRNRTSVIRTAAVEFEERSDVPGSLWERKKELARRILVCHQSRQDEMLDLKKTERIYQLVEMSAAKVRGDQSR